MKDPRSSAYTFAYFVDVAGREIDISRRHRRRFALATIGVHARKRARRRAGADAWPPSEGVLGAVRDTDVLARVDANEFYLLLARDRRPRRARLPASRARTTVGSWRARRTTTSASASRCIRTTAAICRGCFAWRAIAPKFAGFPWSERSGSSASRSPRWSTRSSRDRPSTKRAPRSSSRHVPSSCR